MKIDYYHRFPNGTKIGRVRNYIPWKRSRFVVALPPCGLGRVEQIIYFDSVNHAELFAKEKDSCFRRGAEPDEDREDIEYLRAARKDASFRSLHDVLADIDETGTAENSRF